MGGALEEERGAETLDGTAPSGIVTVLQFSINRKGDIKSNVIGSIKAIHKRLKSIFNKITLNSDSLFYIYSININLYLERKYISPNEENGLSASDSAENLSSGSNNQQNSNRNSNNMETNNLIPPILTKSLLNKHNENMEKLMFQKHRELKSIIKKCDKESRLKYMKEKSTEPKLPQGKGVKRSRSYSREKNHKVNIIIFLNYY